MKRRKRVGVSRSTRDFNGSPLLLTSLKGLSCGKKYRVHEFIWKLAVSKHNKVNAWNGFCSIIEMQ
jgi:hypothetical protein